MSRKYLATLAAVAALVLIVGLIAKRWLDVGTAPAAVAAPPSEAAAFRQLSQEVQLRRTADFLAQRAEEVAAFVTYRPELGAASVRLPDGVVVSTTRDAPLVALPNVSGDSTAPTPPLELPADSLHRGWVIVVGRSADGGVLSVSGMAGGRVPATCAGRPTQELLVGTPLYDALAGGGVFAVDGRLLGVVARCAERVVAIPLGAVAPLLAEAARADSIRADSVRADSARADSARADSIRRRARRRR